MGSKHRQAEQEGVETKLNGYITYCLQLSIFFLGVKCLVLICRSVQVSKKSSWEFVGELSNTIRKNQGHEKK